MTETILLKREKYVDVVAGFLIALMIYHHCKHFSHFQEPFLYHLMGFTMPWFFYKSGMFFTPKQQSTLMKKDANKLLRSFVVYSFIGWVVWCACGLIDESLLVKDCIVRPIRSFFHHGSVVGNEALWFLLTLFIVRQCANVMLKKMPPLFYLQSVSCPLLHFMCWGGIDILGGLEIYFQECAFSGLVIG